MRCPKCQYISFDSGDRCRNCGYDFSLSADTTDAETPDLPIQNGSEPIGPLSELSLRDVSAVVDDVNADTDVRVDQPSPRPITSSLDLPLFRDRPANQDAPLVDANAAPRAPLAVRRATVPLPRQRGRRGGAAAAEDPNAEPRLALDAAEMAAVPDRARGRDVESAVAPAPILARIAAGLLDLLVVGSIDLVVVYFTLRICELTFAEWKALPLAPLVAFLALLDGGYFTIFVAAGGQTIGKMLGRIRVIPGHPDATATERVPLGRAIVRSAAYLASALPAGMGFVAAVVGDRRALHDRLADTRVVKA